MRKKWKSGSATLFLCTVIAFLPSLGSVVAAVPGRAQSTEFVAMPEWSDRFGTLGLNESVLALTVFDTDGPGPERPKLVAAGGFTSAGGVPSNSVALWNGTTWSSLPGAGGTNGVNGAISDLTVFDPDGSGPNSPMLVAGGFFATAGGVACSNIAAWNGSVWLPIPGAGGTNGVSGGGFPRVLALTVYDDDGSGPNLPQLIVAGSFTSAGGIACNNIARWNGSAWSPLLGLNGTNGANSEVSALAVFDDDGPGPNHPQLVAGGFFDSAGGVSCNSIARWNGSVWSRLLGAGGTNGVAGSIGNSSWVQALTVYPNNQSGSHLPQLIVGGRFESAGGVACENVARWSGAAWSPLIGAGGSNGVDSDVFALTVFDNDGIGPSPPEVIAGGWFFSAGSEGCLAIARWNGSAWLPLPGVNGTNGVIDPNSPGPRPPGEVFALGVFDEDDSGPGLEQLYVGGSFTLAGGIPSMKIAAWGRPTPPVCPADLNADGQVNTADLTFFLGRFGQTATPGSLAQLADFNSDGIVNTSDLTFFLGRFGQTCP